MRRSWLESRAGIRLEQSQLLRRNGCSIRCSHDLAVLLAELSNARVPVRPESPMHRTDCCQLRRGQQVPEMPRLNLHPLLGSVAIAHDPRDEDDDRD